MKEKTTGVQPENKKSPVITIGIWIITVGLAVFYLGLFYAGMHRNTSREYELIYAGDDYVFAHWPGNGGLDYNLGDVEDFNTKKLNLRLGFGWNTYGMYEDYASLITDGGFWSENAVSHIFYHITEEQACTVTMQINIAKVKPEDVVRVYVNDELVADNLNVGTNNVVFQYDPSVDLYDVRFEEGNTYDETVVHAVAPDAKVRTIGFQLKSLTISKGDLR